MELISDEKPNPEAQDTSQQELIAEQEARQHELTIELAYAVISMGFSERGVLPVDDNGKIRTIYPDRIEELIKTLPKSELNRYAEISTNPTVRMSRLLECYCTNFNHDAPFDWNNEVAVDTYNHEAGVRSQNKEIIFAPSIADPKEEKASNEENEVSEEKDLITWEMIKEEAEKKLLYRANKAANILLHGAPWEKAVDRLIHSASWEEAKLTIHSSMQFGDSELQEKATDEALNILRGNSNERPGIPKDEAKEIVKIIDGIPTIVHDRLAKVAGNAWKARQVAFWDARPEFRQAIKDAGLLTADLKEDPEDPYHTFMYDAFKELIETDRDGASTARFLLKPEEFDREKWIAGLRSRFAEYCEAHPDEIHVVEFRDIKHPGNLIESWKHEPAATRHMGQTVLGELVGVAAA
ncbi:hypothetical protein EOM57_04135 [Candidatus Saccharibacteria bacterium]|nr:hypothetical protein [Candidatus Saccharibacteria bacterium]